MGYVTYIRPQQEMVIDSADTTSWVKQANKIQNYISKQITICTDNFSGNLKFYVGGTDGVDIADTATSSNPYDGVQIIRYNDQAPTNGTTGLSYTTDTTQKTYKINADYVHSFGVKADSATGGTVKIYFDAVGI